MEIKVPYFCSKLNGTTHLIIQNDSYSEFPFIYVKLCSNPPLAVIFDTGCGADNGNNGYSPMELKEFIENQVVTDDTTYEHLIICTHCHFDHIGGIEAFSEAGADILASAYDREFLLPENRPANSLCEVFGMETPKYNVTHYLKDDERITHHGRDLELQALHTPGHTPDSLAVYDEAERWLFVGDTCSQRVQEMPWGENQNVPIIVPLQGNWKDFLTSVQKLPGFVGSDEEATEAKSCNQCIRIASGHTTSCAAAAEMLRNVLKFSNRIANGSVPVVAKLPGDQIAPGGSLGDEMFVFWQDDKDPEFSLIAPEKFERDF